MNKHLTNFVSKRIYSLNRRCVSSQCRGLKETFDEHQARLYFSQWLRSLWFAPNNWIQQTNLDKINIDKIYVPFWNYSLQGSIQSNIRLSRVTHVKYKNTLVPHRQWFSVPLQLNLINLNDVNVYAAQSFDRFHINQLPISFQHRNLVQLNQRSTEQWTVDKDTAFQIGWDLQIVPQLKSILQQKASELYSQYSDCQVDSFHFHIASKNQRIVYYPIYVVKYQYDSHHDFTCFIDGINGQVTGDRQYSMIKVTLASLIAFYPTCFIALSTLGSLIDPSIAIQFTSILTPKIIIPLALICSPILGFLAKNYPKYYKDKMKEKQWDNYQSNSSQFTYDFTSSYHQQKQQYYQQQQQQSYQQKETFKEKKQEKKVLDLYELLSVDRNATEREIKRAYLLKAKELHPDRNPGNKQAEELFKQVNQAYAILSNPFQRKQYDQYGFDAVKYN